ncbi:MAG TPA: polysaccharide biosynthesis tyrosine autokinase [Planctomycetota bacterium]|nr:polysaccharide biosynthesis tyrosine autokinase [Planctomycetota bacterium]HRR81540.1 polysaccharide biosynthesis tyrosine autokinase [Planctomycetota bacterium]HRT94920.1 polysaccharide biosynthesis tyrosine autokinase [Planctomycetota bacterium]
METQQYPIVPHDPAATFHDAPAAHGLDLRRVLRQRGAVGLLVFALLAPAFVAWAWFHFQPRYVAEAIVQVNAVRPKVLYRTDDSTTGATFTTFFNTQVVTLTSTDLLNRCLKDPAVSGSHILAGAEDLTQALRDALEVTKIANTQYLSVKVRGDKPQGLAAVANTIVRTYMAFIEEADSSSQNRKIQLLEAEKKKLALDAETKMAALAQSRAAVAGNPDASSGALIRDPMSVTHEALVSLRKEQASLQAKAESLRAGLSAADVEIPAAVLDAAVDREPEVEPLMALAGQLRREIALADSEAGSPLVSTVQARMNAELQLTALKQEIARRELHVVQLAGGPKAAPAAPDGGDQESTPAILAELLADDPEGKKLAELAIQLQRESLLLRATGDEPSAAMIRERLDRRPQILALKSELMRKEVDLATKAETLRDTHPGLMSASAALEGLRTRLAKTEAELRDEVVQELKQETQQRQREVRDQLRMVEEQLRPFCERALPRARTLLSAARERLAVLEPEVKNRIIAEVKADAGRRAQELRQQLASIEGQLRERRERARVAVIARLREEARTQMARRLKELEADLAANATSETALRNMIAKQAEQRVVAERKAAELKTLEDDLARTRQSLLGVEQRLHELEVEAGAPGYISIASMATDPKFPEPYMPKRIKYGVAGVLGAAGLALLAMLLLDRQDDRIRCPEDLKGVAGVDLLGCVPHWGEAIRTAGSPALLCGPGVAAPRLVAEEVRNLVVHLLSPSAGHAVRTVLVTGAAPGDGRTTLAVNVAACVTSVGKRVILVDASFRKPDVAPLFGAPVTPGLGDVLARRAQVSDVIRNTSIPGLSILPAGSQPVDTVGALGSETMQSLLDALGGQFDYVIVDGPPLMLADARILAPMVDAVVCALRAPNSRRAMATECLATLRRLGARVLGMVLVGVRPEHNGYAATAAALHSYARAGRATQVAQIAGETTTVEFDKTAE